MQVTSGSHARKQQEGHAGHQPSRRHRGTQHL